MSTSPSLAKIAYIGLGSNLATPAKQIRSARAELLALPDVTEVAFSNLYASKPMGPQDQPDFVNAVMALKTQLKPLALLAELHTIELAHGRVRGNERWGARTLDLDILLYGDEQINLPELTVPHPGIADRPFVLYLLKECNPDLDIPGRGKLADMLTQCPLAGLRLLDKDDYTYG